MKNRLIGFGIVALMAGMLTWIWAADEVTVTTLLKVENGNFNYQRSVANYRLDQDAQGADMGVQTFTQGSTNVLNINNVSAPHYLFLRNLDLTNNIFVTLTVCLKSNDVAVVPVASTNISAYVTNAGISAKLDYWINQQ